MVGHSSTVSTQGRQDFSSQGGPPRSPIGGRRVKMNVIKVLPLSSNSIRGGVEGGDTVSPFSRFKSRF